MVRSAVLGNNDIAKLIFWSLTIPDLCRVERVSAWLRVAASTDETFRLALESLLAPAVAGTGAQRRFGERPPLPGPQALATPPLCKTLNWRSCTTPPRRLLW